jgi:spermidine/putrescine transport system substrate-binding protein
LPVGEGVRHRALPAFANPGFDPGRKFSLPWSSTVVGLVFDRRRVHDPVRSATALFDPKFAGKVVLSADAASTLGLVALASGHKPAAVTAGQATAAVARVRGAVESGQVRSFATTEYIDDLVSGRALLAVGRADEIRDALPVSPTLTFVVPTEGGLFISTNMVVPVGARNVDEAGTFIEYMFKPDPSSRFASFSGRAMAVAGAIDSLWAIDPKSARDPLVQPDPTVWSRLAIWPGAKATGGATAEFASLVASHRS